MEFHVVIPARYASTRLPAKPLSLIAGRPMLAHVYERAQASGAAQVIIATDDARIAQAAAEFGATAWLTDVGHRSGTDRVAEVAARAGLAPDAIVVNLQGDEPAMPPALIRQAAQALAEHPAAQVATLCEALFNSEDLANPNVVKVVRDLEGYALYFSRAPLPWARDRFVHGDYQPVADMHFRHIGLYAYRAGYVQEFARLPPTELERLEALEQLRVLAHGGKIYVAEACAAPGPGVDTPEDLARVRALLESP